jgi:2-oxoglutarate dehydrogenase E2 component (dihydrolipoamide succinyltransferase)
MATDVVMPQMGESVTEGTIVRWMKKVGDKIDRDEPLLEITTDKVDAEVPSPAAGIVVEIRAQEGETVAVNHVLAVIGSPDAAVQTPAKSAPAVAAPAAAPADHAPVVRAAGSAPSSLDDMARDRSSPLVRRMAREHNIDLSQVHGTGIAGRVTKDDLLDYIEQGARAGQASREGQAGQAGRAGDVAHASLARPGDRVEAMSPMRKKIAEHMVASRRTSAHVHTVFEVNFSHVARIRQQTRAGSDGGGGKLTYLAFIIKAVADALREAPALNASVDGDSIIYHTDVNVGVAVALDWGLIVPVIRHADTLDLHAIGRAIADLAGRARARQLTPDDVAGGTFTITNPGMLGAEFGTPIINQPQVAILAVGAIEKRPAVVNDALAVQTMAYLALGFDHRIIDGVVADGFMSRVKHALEHWDAHQA